MVDALRCGISLFVAAALVAGCAGAPEGLEEVGEAESAYEVCADGPTVEGIDVSVWQADVNWPAVASDGISFGIARVSYGVSKDEYFDGNWSGMKAAGIVRGAYQYFLPQQDPIAQADVMLDAIGALEPGDLAPVIDVETTGGMSASAIESRVGQWIAHVEAATGRKPIVYTGKYFWQDYVASGAFSEYPLWIPNYSFDCPNLPDGYWDDWALFQYTDSGSVSGVSGNVDRNKFNGSLQDLQAFANGGGFYKAEFVEQSFPYASQGPLTMVAGEAVQVYIELRNTGSEPWDASTRLAATEPRDRESAFAGPEWPAPNRFAQVEGIVQPGETFRFTFEMHAPLEPGLYDEFFGLVQEGVTWFSDPGHGGPPDDVLEGLFEVLPNPNAGNGGAGGGGGGTGGGGEGGVGPKADDANAEAGCAVRPAPGVGGSAAAWVLIGLGAAALRRRRQRNP